MGYLDDKMMETINRVKRRERELGLEPKQPTSDLPLRKIRIIEK